MRQISLSTSDLISNIKSFKAGDKILLSGTIYTARDAAHIRLIKGSLPKYLKNSIIYYCGPTPARDGNPVGSCGPTTSSRMDKFTPKLLKKGIRVTIGKGPRSIETIKALKKNKALYLVATGGIGALLSQRVKSSKLMAYKELGPEAIYKLEVKDFPLIVANDIYGGSVFKKV